MTITLYSKPNCVQCEYTAKQLDAKGLSYNKIDVTIDAAAREVVEATGNRTLPYVTVVHDDGRPAQDWHGFHLEKIRGLSKDS